MVGLVTQSGSIKRESPAKLLLNRKMETGFQFEEVVDIEVVVAGVDMACHVVVIGG
jgi:hypothetical protein